MNPYEALGVSRDATPEEIEAAFRRSAKQHHPDTGGDAEKFVEAGKAISLLRDPDRRKRYDQSGDEENFDISFLPLQEIAKVFQTMIMNDGVDFVQTDIVLGVKQVLQAQILSVSDTITNLTRMEAKVETAIKRIKPTGKKKNRIKPMLTWQLGQIKLSLEAKERHRQVLLDAMAILQDHTYETTQPFFFPGSFANVYPT